MVGGLDVRGVDSCVQRRAAGRHFRDALAFEEWWGFPHRRPEYVHYSGGALFSCQRRVGDIDVALRVDRHALGRREGAARAARARHLTHEVAGGVELVDHELFAVTGVEMPFGIDGQARDVAEEVAGGAGDLPDRVSRGTELIDQLFPS